MNKKIFFSTILVLTMFIFPTIVNASFYARVNDGKTEVRIRSDYKSTSNLLGYANEGDTFDLYDKNIVDTTSACPSGWYKINYGGKTGYLCSSYVTVFERKDEVVIDTAEARNACESDLKAKGFPSSYWKGLCDLKIKYPNWTFEPVNTGLNFSDAVAGESKCGKNTIKTTDDSMVDTSCSGSYDSGYRSTSPKAVAYYMNPLNFLTESGIFMFEANQINPKVGLDAYKSVTPSILGSFMTTNLPTLTSAMYTAGTTYNVSPIILSARIHQEIGKGQATTGAYKGGLLSCISGDYTTRWNKYAEDGGNMNYYYNFFNVGVYDGSNGDAPYRAVHYAYKHGWGGSGNQETDLTRAIGGGADFLNSHYINRGQNTIYFHKFNTHPNNVSSLYVNQYMSNIAGPSDESKTVYNAYRNANLLSSSLVFYVPIYYNLDAEISNSGDGATGETTQPNQNEGMSVTTMIVSSGLKLNGNEISGINPGTSINVIKDKINALGGTVTSSNNGIVGTGTKIIVSNGSSKSEYTIIIKGDTSGDGVINALDLLQIQKNILGLYNLDGAYKKAADPSGDGTVNALDLLQVQKNILGSYTISQ